MNFALSQREGAKNSKVGDASAVWFFFHRTCGKTGLISWWRQVHCTRNQAACFVPLGPMPMLLGRTDTAHRRRSQSAALLLWVRKWNRPPICYFFSLSTERAVETIAVSREKYAESAFWYKRGLFLGTQPITITLFALWYIRYTKQLELGHCSREPSAWCVQKASITRLLLLIRLNTMALTDCNDH